MQPPLLDRLFGIILKPFEYFVDFKLTSLCSVCVYDYTQIGHNDRHNFHFGPIKFYPQSAESLLYTSGMPR